MFKYEIDDMRLLYENDTFLETVLNRTKDWKMFTETDNARMKNAAVGSFIQTAERGK